MKKKAESFSQKAIPVRIQINMINEKAVKVHFWKGLWRTIIVFKRAPEKACWELANKQMMFCLGMRKKKSKYFNDDTRFLFFFNLFIDPLHIWQTNRWYFVWLKKGTAKLYVMTFAFCSSFIYFTIHWIHADDICLEIRKWSSQTERGSKLK